MMGLILCLCFEISYPVAFFFAGMEWVCPGENEGIFPGNHLFVMVFLFLTGGYAASGYVGMRHFIPTYPVHTQFFLGHWVCFFLLFPCGCVSHTHILNHPKKLGGPPICERIFP